MIIITNLSTSIGPNFGTHVVYSLLLTYTTGLYRSQIIILGGRRCVDSIAG